MHCSGGNKVESTWTNWVTEGYCDETSFFKQKYRNCKSASNGIPFCEGRWLDLVPCGLCNKPITENTDYNQDYSTDYDYSSYSSSYSSSSRRKRDTSNVNPICKCKPDTIWETRIIPGNFTRFIIGEIFSNTQIF